MKKQANKPSDKPSPEAKALTLFLMAFKSKDPRYKEELKRINRQWDLFKVGELHHKQYVDEVNTLLTKYGGYTAVIEQTVRYYIDKTGAWKASGEDQYQQDAQAIADKLSQS